VNSDSSFTSNSGAQRPALEVFGATIRLGGREILTEVSFDLRQGEILALVGPNGSGKSTLLKWIAGIAQERFGRFEGMVRYQGVDIGRWPIAQRAAQLVYLGAELLSEFPLTAHEVVALGDYCNQASHSSELHSRPSPSVEEAMKSALCWKFRHQELMTLSGGERQRVLLARSLHQGARVLLIDESLSKMDLHHQARMGELLQHLTRREGYSVIWVAHDLHLIADFSDRCALLFQGKIQSIGETRVILNQKNLETLYPGTGWNVELTPGGRLRVVPVERKREDDRSSI